MPVKASSANIRRRLQGAYRLLVEGAQLADKASEAAIEGGQKKRAKRYRVAAEQAQSAAHWARAANNALDV